jgi:magnesium-transporting ATPase (P-type)
MDSLGAIMLGNEPAKEEYMLEKPRQRDEAIISVSMLKHILIMAIWFTIISLCFLKLDFFKQFLAPNLEKGMIDEQIKTAFFVLFIWAALFNAFNVRDKGFKIFGGLNENKSFLIVFISIVLIQAAIVNISLIPGNGLDDKIGDMFSCEPFAAKMWLVVLLLSVSMIPINLLLKCIIKNNPTILETTNNPETKTKVEEKAS